LTKEWNWHAVKPIVRMSLLQKHVLMSQNSWILKRLLHSKIQKWPNI